jgi:hypothetical protein
VDVAWTLHQQAVANLPTEKALAGEKQKPSNGLEPLTPSLPWNSNEENGVALRRRALLVRD